MSESRATDKERKRLAKEAEKQRQREAKAADAMRKAFGK